VGLDVNVVHNWSVFSIAQPFFGVIANSRAARRFVGRLCVIRFQATGPTGRRCGAFMRKLRGVRYDGHSNRIITIVRGVRCSHGRSPWWAPIAAYNSRDESLSLTYEESVRSHCARSNHRPLDGVAKR